MKKAPMLKSFLGSMATCLRGQVLSLGNIGRIFKTLAAQVREARMNGSAEDEGKINKALAEKVINVIVEEGEYPMLDSAIVQESEQVLPEGG